MMLWTSPFFPTKGGIKYHVPVIPYPALFSPNNVPVPTGFELSKVSPEKKYEDGKGRFHYTPPVASSKERSVDRSSSPSPRRMLQWLVPPMRASISWATNAASAFSEWRAWHNGVGPRSLWETKPLGHGDGL